MENILENRGLSPEEFNLLNFLFDREKPEWVPLLKDLEVKAKCGCGSCPTVFFVSETPIQEVVVIDYLSEDKEGRLIAVYVMSSADKPTSLHFDSLDGLSEDICIPRLENLKPSKN